MRLGQKFKSHWVALTGIIWLVLWLTLIDPQTASPVLLLPPFVLIVFLLHRLAVWLVRGFGSGGLLSRRHAILTWFASVLIGVALVLSSLGQLGWREGLTLLAIAAIGLVYVVRLVPKQSQ